MGEITLRQTIGQLRQMADRERFDRDRLGSPGCLARRHAGDNLAALEAAINLLAALHQEQGQ
jgi:hypothetical protein